MPSDNVSYVRLPHEAVRAHNSGAERKRTSDNVRSVTAEPLRPTVRCLLPTWTWEAFAARAYVLLVALMALGFGWMLVRLLT